MHRSPGLDRPLAWAGLLANGAALLGLPLAIVLPGPLPQARLVVALAAVLPTLMSALERHGHWQVDLDLREKLLQISPATIDRLLAPARSAQGGQHRRRRTRVVTGVRRRTTVRTFNGWKDVEPG